MRLLLFLLPAVGSLLFIDTFFLLIYSELPEIRRRYHQNTIADITTLLTQVGVVGSQCLLRPGNNRSFYFSGAATFKIAIVEVSGYIWR